MIVEHTNKGYKLTWAFFYTRGRVVQIGIVGLKTSDNRLGQAFERWLSARSR